MTFSTGKEKCTKIRTETKKAQNTQSNPEHKGAVLKVS
jgi:hypothetical protein